MLCVTVCLYVDMYVCIVCVCVCTARLLWHASVAVCLVTRLSCVVVLAGLMGSYPQEPSGFGPARAFPADPPSGSTAHISFTPNVTYSLAPGMTPIQGTAMLCPPPPPPPICGVDSCQSVYPDPFHMTV